LDFANTLIAIWPKLMKYSRSLTKGNYAAEDLVMEVITKILESAERIDPNTNLEAYAIRAIKNTFLNEVKWDNKTVSEINDSGESIYDETRDENSGKFTESGDLEKILMNLGSKCKEILVLFGIGSSYKEIASLLDVKIGTVMSRMARCRGSLSDQLEAS
jgi:RNA polymerase sigma-70 factor (ECF subfamily)|tara:strand:- start:493 stop:972 length:480 start_codon:yes stop_codon:yes gene_type:complete